MNRKRIPFGTKFAVYFSGAELADIRGRAFFDSDFLTGSQLGIFGLTANHAACLNWLL